MAKKKRSAKQLANDRRLGRMAKARAKAKRGGRSRVTRKKVARKNPHRKIRASGVKRQIRAPAAKRKVSVKSNLWRVFKCYGKSVRYLGMTMSGKTQWTIRDAAMIFTNKTVAIKIAKGAAKKRGMASYHIGVASSATSTALIAAQCKGGKV